MYPGAGEVCGGCLAAQGEGQRARLQHARTDLLGRWSTHLPYVCHECAHHIWKYTKFQRKCQRAQLLVEQLYEDRLEVTAADIKAIDRIANGLNSTLAICNLAPINITVSEDYPKIETEGDGVWIIIDNIKEEVEDDYRELLSIPAVQTDSEEETPLKAFMDGHMKETVARKRKERKITNKQAPLKAKGSRTSLLKRLSKATKRSKETRRKTPKERKRKDFGPVTKDAKLQEFARVVVMTQEEAIEDIRRRVDSTNYTQTTYKCELCFKGFWESSTFNNHMMKHSPENGEYECDFCHFRFLNRIKLVSHIRAFHTLKIHCKRCSYVSSSGCLARHHEAWHNGTSYTCHLCEEKFRYYTTLRNHIRIKHPMQFACSLCGLCFVSQLGVETHVQRSHKCDQVKTEGDGHFCVECDIIFATLEAWKRHLVVSAKHNLKETANGCEICGETFPTRQDYQAHHRLHYSMNPLKYKILRKHHTDGNRKLKTPNGGKERVKVERKNLMCETCGRVCTTIAGFRVHTMKHTGERPYKCNVCNKSFSVKVLMTDHMRTHTKERPFECAECGRGFAAMSNLRRHVKLVHSDCDPVNCELCGKQFKNTHCLKDHVKYVHLKKPYPVRKGRYGKRLEPEGLVRSVPSDASARVQPDMG